ncbi:peptidylprolyl isomerase [Coraliomargarita parva]|uniref:peptidylprolyl isomerase n=1 Tax=Coraliomargarita parva TaxID=3014050 RepID=UPI0022B54E78|nr:peptidylprolyl isomerase [Coraliomargarita parva]
MQGISQQKYASRRAIAGVCLTALLAAVFAGCSPEVETDPVAIQVGDREVRLSELQAQVDFLEAQGSLLSTDRDAFMQRYTERLAALQRARELGLDRDLALQHQWENLLIGRLHQQEVEQAMEALAVTEDEIGTYYDSHIGDYTKPALARPALLYLKKGKHLDEAGRRALSARLEEARQRVAELPETSRGFGALAMEYSEEGTSRFKGGDIGWLQDGQARYRWPLEVVEASFALSETGELSPVIETDDGFYLLMLLDKRAASVRSMEGRLSASIEHKLLQAKKQEIETRLKAQWRDDAGLLLHSNVLSQLDFKTTENNGEGGKAFTQMP